MSLASSPGRRGKLRYPAAWLAMWACCGSVAQAQQFTFAGLSLRTTLEQARTRYPNSLIAGLHVYVAERDSHDHIYAIDLPNGAEAALRVFFEHQRERTPEYPACQTVLTKVNAAYGQPGRVQEFDEERMRNRRYLWTKGSETLALLCFQDARGVSFASDLAITAGP